MQVQRYSPASEIYETRFNIFFSERSVCSTNIQDPESALLLSVTLLYFP